MGMNKPDIHDALKLRRTAGIFDHFNNYTDAGLWTKGGAGTVVNGDGDGGILTLTTGAVAFQPAYVGTTRKNWTFVAGKPMVFQIGLAYTEAAVNQAAIFVGFTSALATMFSGAGALLANFSGCGIFKKAGDVLWSAITSVGVVQQITQSKSSCIQAGLMQELFVQVMLNQNSQLEATFQTGGLGPITVAGGGANGQNPMINNVSGMSGIQPIKHFAAYAGAAAMSCGIFVQAAAGGASEIVSVDYIGNEFLAMP